MRRLSPALLTMVMLGVVGLLVVLYVGKKLLARDTAPPADPTMSVPMPLTDLEPGTRITEAHIGNGPVLRSKLTRDTVTTSRAIVGRVVKNRILATQPIKSTDLYAPGQNAPLNLEPGMVAVTVPITSPVPAGRGQYVDVHFTPDSDPDQESTGGRIMTLFKGVKILEISAGSAVRGGANLILELTREQANIILLAKDRGTLNFVFAPEGKGSGGIAVSDEDRATLYEILGYTPKPAVEPEKPFITEIFKGNGGREARAYRNGRFEQDYFESPLDQRPIDLQPGRSMNTRPNGGGGGGNNGGNRESGAGGGGGAPEGGGPSASRSQTNQFSR